MSGLFGFASHRYASDASIVLERMSKRLRHDPRTLVEWSEPRADFGVGRVAAGVLNRGPQPYRSADGAVRLWFCGEDYHRPARWSTAGVTATRAEAVDAGEVALQSYLTDGAIGVSTIDGMFLAVIWDERRRELFLINDRYGLYPHYFAHARGAFVFAPEIKAILSWDRLPRTVDLTAIAQYARFQQILGDRTWLEDVVLLPAATILRYQPDDDVLALTRYWDWDRIGTAPPMSIEDVIGETARLLERSLAARSAPPHRLGLYLSGGLDSRAILACLPDRTAVRTFTYGAAGSRDVLYASRLARLAGTTHEWFPFEDGRWMFEHIPQHLALTEGMHSFIHAHGMTTLARARESVDVMLTGWRRGSLHMLRHLSSVQAAPETLTEAELTRGLFEMFCRTTSWPGLDEAEAALLHDGAGRRDLRDRAFDSLHEEFARTRHYPPDRRADYFYTEQHERRSSINLVVFTRSAIDVRSPLFDYAFLDFVYSVLPWPHQFLFVRANVVTSRAPRLALVPNERDGRIPHTNPLIAGPHALLVRAIHWTNRRIAPVFNDPPSLYADYEHYLRTDLREWAEAILFDPVTEARGFFDPHAVRALWNRHQSGTQLWTIGKVAPLITTELVLRYLLDASD